MPALTFSAVLAAGDPAGLASFEAHAGLLSRVYPQWHSVGSTGLPLCRLEVESGLRQKVRSLAHKQGVELWPQVSLHPVSSPVSGLDFSRLLADGALRNAHSVALVRMAQEDGAQGLSLDYGCLHDADRSAFARLASELASAFHAAGLKLGLVVSARTGQGDEPGAETAPDYASLAPLCDRLQIKGFGSLCGDGTGFDGVRGPIAAPEWCGDVLAHVETSVPASKIEWGLPLFGYDWGQDRVPLEITHSQWAGLVQAHPPERRDPHSGEMTLAYDGREVWMNDSISLTGKLWQVRRHGVGEVSLWNLGAEDPRLWALVDSLPKDFL